MNPGEKYRNTRHNAGAMALDLLFPEARYRHTGALHGDVAQLTTDAAEWLLLKPDTFMNLSGNAVLAAMKKFSLSPAQVVVLHDEVELPPREVRYKFGGGHKGHNGLRSIIGQIGSADFHRIRIGVGRPRDDRAGIADFLLSVQPVAERAEKSALEEALGQVMQSIYNA